MRRLINNHSPERVLFITYRQTLVRDIMRNFGKLDFKNYIESYDDPTVWQAPRMIIQPDGLLNLVCKRSGVLDGEGFEFSYDVIALAEKRIFNA